MPVVFDQPAPVEASAAAGTAAQLNQDRQYALQMYALQSQAGQQNADRQARNAQAQAQMELQAGVANAARNPSERDAFLGRQQAGLQEQQFGQQQALAAQHVQAQAWLGQQELSQAEQVSLQRMQQNIGAIQADDSLSDEDKASLVGMLRQRIDPLKARQQKMEEDEQEQQQKKTQNLLAQQEAIQSLNEKFAAGNIEALPLLRDPVTGAQHRMLRNHNGEWYDPFKGARPEKGTTAAEVAKATQEGDRHFRDAWVDAHKLLTTEELTGGKKHPDESAVQDQLRKWGFGGTIDEDRGRRGGKAAAPGGQPAAQPEVSSLLGSAFELATARGDAETTAAIKWVQDVKARRGSLTNMTADEAKEFEGHMKTIKEFMAKQSARAVEQARREEPVAPVSRSRGEQARQGMGGNMHTNPSGNPLLGVWNLIRGQE